MATTVSTPVMAYVASIQTLTGIQYSASLYFSVYIDPQWEARIPVQVRFSLVSADPNVFVYQSHDKGGTYDTTPMAGFSIARLASASAFGSIALPTGYYLLQVQHSGPNSGSVAILTQDQITAIANV